MPGQGRKGLAYTADSSDLYKGCPDRQASLPYSRHLRSEWCADGRKDGLRMDGWVDDGGWEINDRHVLLEDCP